MVLLIWTLTSACSQNGYQWKRWLAPGLQMQSWMNSGWGLMEPLPELVHVIKQRLGITKENTERREAEVTLLSFMIFFCNLLISNLRTYTSGMILPVYILLHFLLIFLDHGLAIFFYFNLWIDLQESENCIWSFVNHIRGSHISFWKVFLFYIMVNIYIFHFLPEII